MQERPLAPPLSIPSKNFGKSVHSEPFHKFVSICSFNVNRLFTHFNEFFHNIVVGNYDIVTIYETWLKPVMPSNSFHIEGYNLIRNDKLQRDGGGAAIYIKIFFRFEFHTTALLIILLNIGSFK